MLDDLANAANVRRAGDGIAVDDSKSEIGLEKGVHHHPVPELKDLQGQNCPGEEHQR